MQLGMIGLGRMGGNMVERLHAAGHDVVVYDRDPDAVRRLATQGVRGAAGLAELAGALAAPRAIWMMVPAGAPVDETIEGLRPHLAGGDVLIDGGNSRYTDSVRRAELLLQHDIDFVDAGTSGGIWGRTEGYCLMVGASERAYARCEPIFRDLAPPGGYGRVGPPGAGHFVKMVHNGIEYGLLQAYAEGYEILHASDEFSLDLHQVAGLWNHGSVVRSWLNELAERAFATPGAVEALRGYVDDTGEGRWTVQEAIDRNVPAPVITLALLMRLRSRQADSFGAKVIAALRNEFGGHAVKRS